ncbi:MAG: DUF6361 family protein [Actinomycetota bacterium]
MASTLAWLDYSERDRRRALDVVDLLREPSTVDELGLGTVRDAFADMLFPGTSTIQTRARYFLFVPWIYLVLEKRRVASGQIVSRARKEEVALIDALVESGERDGVIGIQARRALKRLPSNVYWNGLWSWGVRRFNGTQPQYHRSLDLFYESPRAVPDDDGDPSQGKGATNWHPELPRAPRDFPKGYSLALTQAEARFLRERIIFSHPHSLLASLVDRARTSEVDFAWVHPDLGKLDSVLKERLEHARLFSEAMHGAQLLYNEMLSEAIENDEWKGWFVDALAGWTELMNERADALRSWDLGRFWAIIVDEAGVIRPRTRTFIDRWLEIAIDPKAAAEVVGSNDARALIEQREEELKGARARLQNRQALMLWQGDAGSAQMDFRWRVSQRIVNDILEGLGRDA